MTDQVQFPSSDEKPPYEKPQIIHLSDLTAGQGFCLPGSFVDPSCIGGGNANMCELGEVPFL